jgi:LEA14-like dessication related protein
MKESKRKLCLFVTFLWAFSAPALTAFSKEDLNISLKETAIKDFSLSGLTLVFYIRILNSSSSPYYFSSYDYRFVVNQKEYLRLSASLERSIEIEAKEDALISFPMKITYDYLFQTVEGLEKEDKAQCYLSGIMVFSDGKKEKARLPFAFSGEFPVFKKPEVEFRSLRVKDMTIGGADISLEIGFKNYNPYELLIDGISYAFYLGEKAVGEGKISGDKNIESRGEKVFSLQFLFNFFEVGKEVYSILHQTSALSRLAGEIEVRTVWGKVKIPFDKSDRVSISRTS